MLYLVGQKTELIRRIKQSLDESTLQRLCSRLADFEGHDEEVSRPLHFDVTERLSGASRDRSGTPATTSRGSAEERCAEALQGVAGLCRLEAVVREAQVQQRVAHG